MPLIIRWPGKIRPNTVSKQVSATFDFTKSFLQLAQAKAPQDRLDGYDIISHVVQQRDDFPRTLFWRGRRGDRTWWAVRDGEMKYVRKTEGGQTEEWLFNLADDIGEQDDLLQTKASAADRLKKLLVEWEAKVMALR